MGLTFSTLAASTRRLMARRDHPDSPSVDSVHLAVSRGGLIVADEALLEMTPRRSAHPIDVSGAP